MKMETMLLTYILGLFVIHVKGSVTLTVPTAGNCGDDTVLTCSVTGSVGFTGWFGLSRTLVSSSVPVRPEDNNKYTETRGTSSFTLTIHNTDITDAGEYRCRNGFEDSQLVRLNIECKASAAVVSVTNGKKVSVTVDKLYPSSPTFSASFRKENTDVTVQGSKTCSSSSQYPGYYRCVWCSSNSLADGSYTYSIVVTTITQADPLTGSFKIVSPQTPVISNTVQLDDTRVVVYGNEGQSLTIQCTSIGGYPTPTVVWYKDSLSSSNQLANTSTGTLQNDGTFTVTLQHTFTPTVSDDMKALICRSYYPQADSAHGGSKSSSATFYLAHGPDDVKFIPDTTNYTIPENTVLDPVTCTASCNPSCSFKWDKTSDGSTISNNAVLNLGMLSSYKAGLYRCTVLGVNRIAKTKNLTVNVIDPVSVKSFYIERYFSQNYVTVDEHEPEIQFKCTVDIFDRNYISTVKLSFGDDVLKEHINKTSLSFVRNDVACFDAGMYTCDGSTTNWRMSSRNVTLFVRCSPRPLRQIKRNITSDLYVPLTLSFTVIAYPEPGPKGFSWYKKDRAGWLRLLSNADLKILSSGLQSNLTFLNVSREDYGHYRVTVTNNVDTYEQNLYVSEEQGQADMQCVRTELDKTGLIVGITLGVVCCVLAVYAVYVTISKKRILTKGSTFLDNSAKQSTHVNPTFASDATEAEDSDGVNTGSGEASVQQYTDLSRYANTDKDTYDVIKKM